MPNITKYSRIVARIKNETQQQEYHLLRGFLVTQGISVEEWIHKQIAEANKNNAQTYNQRRLPKQKKQ